jgi:hypothetical protein
MEGETRETSTALFGIDGILPKDFETMDLSLLRDAYAVPVWQQLQRETQFRLAREKS